MALVDAAMTTGTILRRATSAWRLLNGVFCVYKQPGVSMRKTQKILKYKLCQDLNAMERLPRQDIVQIERVSMNESLTNTTNHNLQQQQDDEVELIGEIPDGKGVIRILKQKSLADHPLLVGPGYQADDIKLINANKLEKESSGVAVMGIGKQGHFHAKLITNNMWLKTYILSGQFGKATNNFFHTGRVLELAKFEKIEKIFIDRILAKSQASHQRLAFDAAGVPIDSERAYELASKGLVRPSTTSSPIVYSVKCIKLDLPFFELEITTINESENYLCQFIHELGQKVHSVAVCTKVRCVKVGPFSSDLALLPKHWTLEYILQNINQTSAVMKDFNLFEREPMIKEF